MTKPLSVNPDLRPMVYPEPANDSPPFGDQTHMSQADLDAVTKATAKRARKAGRKALLEEKHQSAVLIDQEPARLAVLVVTPHESRSALPFCQPHKRQIYDNPYRKQMKREHEDNSRKMLKAMDIGEIVMNEEGKRGIPALS